MKVLLLPNNRVIYSSRSRKHDAMWPSIDAATELLPADVIGSWHEERMSFIESSVNRWNAITNISRETVNESPHYSNFVR